MAPREEAQLATVHVSTAAGGGMWERTRYDWSRPDEARLTVLASNAFAAGSLWASRIRPAGRGGSRVDLTVQRVSKSLNGHVLAAVPRLVGSWVFRRDLEATLARLADAGSAADASTRTAAPAGGAPSTAPRP